MTSLRTCSTRSAAAWGLIGLLLLLSLALLAGCGRTPAGQRWVHRLELRGTRALEAGEILEGLATRKTGWWPFASKQWLDEGALELDLRRIEAYYAARGFFAARAMQKELRQRQNGRSVDITLEVVEGPPTKISELNIAGLEVFPDDRRRRFTAGLGLAVGQRLIHSRYLEAKTLLGTRLAELGHAYAEVSGEVLVDRTARQARVRLRVDPGPLVRMGPVTFQGNGPIPAGKLARLVTWKQGDPFRPEALALSKARLFNQRLFSSVKIDLPREPVALAPVRITVTPAKLHELRLGVGVGIEKKRHEARLSGRWTLRNFLGGMRTLSLQLKPAFVSLPTFWNAERRGLAVQSEIKLSQPDIFSTRILAFALTGYDLGIHEGFQFHGPRLQLGLERPLLRDLLRLGLSWNFQFLDFFDINEAVFDPRATPLGLGFKDPYRLAWLEQFCQLDLRDTLVDPRAGFLAELRLEEGFPQVGGEFTYLKVVPEARGFIPLGTKRLILALRAQLGYLWPRGEESTPLTRRMALGGPTSHRGFTSGRLAPQAVLLATGEPFPVGGAGLPLGADDPRLRLFTPARIPLGGNGSLLGSADLRLRLFRLFDYWLGLTAFLDAGDVVPRLADLDLAQLHLAVGGSLNYQTPIGAIRFGIGVRLNRLGEATADGRMNPDPGERLSFHLTIGEAF